MVENVCAFCALRDNNHSPFVSQSSPNVSYFHTDYLLVIEYPRGSAIVTFMGSVL